MVVGELVVQMKYYIVYDINGVDMMDQSEYLSS